MKRLSCMFLIFAMLFCGALALSSCEEKKEKLSTESDNSDSISDTDNTSSDKTTEITEDESIEHAHTYGEWVVIDEATCQKAGIRARVCLCGSTETEMTEKILCNFINGVCTMCKQNQETKFVPDYAEGKANTVGTEDAISHISAQDGYIYFSLGNKIKKLKQNSTTPELVYTASATEILNVNVVGDWIYFYCVGSSTAKSYIAKVRTDGSGFEKITGSLIVGEMLVVKDTVYYTTLSENAEYLDYGKQIFPLYSISVNGGTPKQLYDGAVGDLVADANYLYFSHVTEEGAVSICRLKHSNTVTSVLLQKVDALSLSLENSKLYFFVVNENEPENLTLASISTNGGGYTTYGKMSCMSPDMHVIGNKAYFVGSAPFSESEPEPEFGLMEYNMTSRRFKKIRDFDEYGLLVKASGSLVCQSFNGSTGKGGNLEIYNQTNGTFKKVKIL